jgi:hypothetical protein
MPFRRRIRRRTIGKEPVKKSRTLLSNIGSGSAPVELPIYVTQVGARSSTGGTQTIDDSQNTNNLVNVGNIVKFVNICIQIAPRLGTSLIDQGWLEWAVVVQREQNQDMLITNLGTQTLQDTASKQYRNNCLFTGCLPLANATANSQDLKIKIPPKRS